MGKWCLHASSFIFDRIIIKVAGNQDRHKSSDEFNFGPLVSMADLYVFCNEIWPCHIGLRWAIVALWATCLVEKSCLLGTLFGITWQSLMMPNSDPWTPHFHEKFLLWTFIGEPRRRLRSSFGRWLWCLLHDCRRSQNLLSRFLKKINERDGLDTLHETAVWNLRRNERTFWEQNKIVWSKQGKLCLRWTDIQKLPKGTDSTLFMNQLFETLGEMKELAKIELKSSKQNGVNYNNNNNNNNFYILGG